MCMCFQIQISSHCGAIVLTTTTTTNRKSKHRLGSSDRGFPSHPPPCSAGILLSGEASPQQCEWGYQAWKDDPKWDLEYVVLATHSFKGWFDKLTKDEAIKGLLVMMAMLPPESDAVCLWLPVVRDLLIGRLLWCLWPSHGHLWDVGIYGMGASMIWEQDAGLNWLLIWFRRALCMF